MTPRLFTLMPLVEDTMPTEALPAGSLTPLELELAPPTVAEPLSPQRVLEAEAETATFPAQQSQRITLPGPGVRVLDLTVATLLTVVTAPLWLCGGILQFVGLLRWRSVPRVGLQNVCFHQGQWEWTRSGGVPAAWIGRLPWLWNVLRGDLAIVGPRPVSPDDPLLQRPGAQIRSSVRPGLVSLWWIRQQANIDYGTEVEADLEYATTRGMKRDLGLAVRALVVSALRDTRCGVQPRIKILGFSIDNLSMCEAVERIVELAHAPQPSQVCFLNADCVNVAYRNPEYRRVLSQAAMTLADGIGLRIAGRWLRRPIRQNVNGTDLFPRLCRRLSGTPLRVFLLGARPGVAQSVADWIAVHYPDVEVAGCQHGYFSPAEEQDVIRRIGAARTDLLLVAFGCPKQELWISQHLAGTGARVALGVGGLFDFYSHRVRRAPQWMRELSLEWLYRVYQEPRRLWRRYFLGNGVFLWRVLREKLFGPPHWG